MGAVTIILGIILMILVIGTAFAYPHESAEYVKALAKTGVGISKWLKVFFGSLRQNYIKEQNNDTLIKQAEVSG